jgi:hypothetical protein
VRPLAVHEHDVDQLLPERARQRPAAGDHPLAGVSGCTGSPIASARRSGSVSGQQAKRTSQPCPRSPRARRREGAGAPVPLGVRVVEERPHTATSRSRNCSACRRA